MIHLPVARNFLLFTAALLLAIGHAGHACAQTELLDFTSVHCGPCQQLKPTIDRLQNEGYPVRVVDLAQHPQLARQYRVDRVPCLVLVVNGHEQARFKGLATYDQIRGLFQSAGVQPVKIVQPTASLQPRGQSPDVRPSLDPSLSIPPSPAAQQNSGFMPAVAPATNSNPPAAAYTAPGEFEQQLLRSSVRIKVEDTSGHSFGTGTIIDTFENDALVITCGHLFSGEAKNGTITIEVFEPTANGVRVVDQVEGQLLTYDMDREIGLVKFRPRTPVAVARVAAQPADRVNDPVWNVGCDRGADPTVRSSRVTALQRYLSPPNIESSGAPVVGRSGGGLFNRHGELIGVCFAADPQGDEGLYASLPSIHSELDRIGLSRIYQGSSNQVATNVSATGERRPATLPVLPSGPAVVRGQTPDGPQNALQPSYPQPENPYPGLQSESQFAGPHAPSPSAFPPVGANATSSYPAATVSPAATDLQRISAPERAALEEIGARAAEGEVVCIFRSREPGGKSEVIHLDHVSPEFLAALRQMQSGPAPR